MYLFSDQISQILYKPLCYFTERDWILEKYFTAYDVQISAGLSTKLASTDTPSVSDQYISTVIFTKSRAMISASPKFSSLLKNSL